MLIMVKVVLMKRAQGCGAQLRMIWNVHGCSGVGLAYCGARSIVESV